MDDLCKCGMPLTDGVKCQCNPELCVYCCECSSDCQCGCSEKRKIADNKTE
ncbi:MAG: hypothetical protein PHR00_02515 [Patescibacteria group bacterium]|nr:hypothetical protein [Patescibacteria group bacterium]